MSDNTTFIHHVGITAPPEVLMEVMTFYDRILGLKPGFRPKFGDLKGHWLYSGENPIVHLLEDSNREGKKSGYFDHLALRCTDLNDVISKLQEHGIKYRQFEMQELNQIQLFLKDPSGTLVELNFEVSA
ncbi:MAG: VOC family protein [Pseudomonadales bacterium]|nr:VOC family protein [Pseudomonadales bacterium]